MSTLWTPDGERPIARPQSPAPPGPSGGAGSDAGVPDEAELRAQMAQLQEQLANTPAEVVVANHAFGLFELAALHLSLQPPKLGEARIAIDALGALVEGMTGRLGDNEAELVQGLAQLRLAFVQIRAAVDAAAGPPADT
jgi:Domain of unknown function (DUF1844)